MTLWFSKPTTNKLAARRASMSTRANKALSEQWKRYPNSKSIVDLRLGNKTNTDLFPAGYDPFFSIRGVLSLPIKGHHKMSMNHVKDRDIIILSDRDPSKGLCLSLCSGNEARIERFKYLCRANLPKELSWFHQSNSRQYQMFEFWKPHSMVVYMKAFFISKEMGLPFKFDTQKAYDTPMTIEPKPFKRFDPMMHSFNDFFGQ